LLLLLLVVNRPGSATFPVSWVETIRVPRAEGRGPPGGADECNVNYHFNVSINWEIRQQQGCIQLTLGILIQHEFDVFPRAVGFKFVLIATVTRSQHRRRKSAFRLAQHVVVHVEMHLYMWLV